MFVILTYDVGEKRVNKVRKKLKKYLIWVQNSVFEGEITKGKLQQCLLELSRIINEKEDSIYIYEVNTPKFITKNIIGQEKSLDDMFL
ncbi:CRISPR-associated protein Cas2 [Caminicella sporogenes DSM 14501]|uniref:CRISPR-associated endoribonuclease Cas2 n=1 Tax=Caminicella sporogenes DSM 14501 TaxID=1121266 RepID=A0A1M6TP65_9FIRM|nr:CRISPR-associated endonuclease Cas2 [Caminicella sporogenes]RKD24807.1 CRISPR-associated endonuclease Cas2 [Caminicella sporogenes]WIF95342.1 CRISPR-associated endonuclease Cas2 [Caminicella sporogenes]SHK58781.1 CRISPR-associated protein Cas2 [Caminicella sporogenes DSM 14501]